MNISSGNKQGIAVVNLPCGTLTEIHDVWVPPSLRQRLGLALFSIGLGLITGTSGIGLIVAENNFDPRTRIRSRTDTSRCNGCCKGAGEDAASENVTCARDS